MPNTASSSASAKPEGEGDVEHRTAGVENGDEAVEAEPQAAEALLAGGLDESTARPGRVGPPTTRP